MISKAAAAHCDILSEDDLVSLDELQEKVAEFEDYVQSSDVVAMQSELSLLFVGPSIVLTHLQSSECFLSCIIYLGVR